MDVNKGENYGNIQVNIGYMRDMVAEAPFRLGTPPPSPLSGEKYSDSGIKWDVALSYASEQEEMVRRVAVLLKVEGLNVFFAPSQKDSYADEDMIRYFYQIFRYNSRYVAAFITEDYLQKDYTMFEADTARLDNGADNHNRFIPIFFGDAKLPGLNPDMCRLRGDNLREAGLADKILQVIRRREGGDTSG